MKIKAHTFYKLLATVACFVVLLSVASAQTSTSSIEGLVIDSVSLKPLIGASISIEGTTIGAVSRAEGQFKLSGLAAGTFTLRVHALGYALHREQIKLRSGEKLSVFVGMHSAPLRQEDVVITANKHLQAMQEVPISTSVVSGGDFSSRNAVQLDQVLRYVPGVNLNDAQVNIRGSSGYSRGLGSRVLFVVDGVPILAGDTGEMKLDAIPQMAIDRVEVVKGAGSALYGSSALGGVVNVITREPDDSLHLYAKLYAGAYPAPSHTEWQWYSGARTQSGIDAGFSDVVHGLAITATGGYRDNEAYRQNDDYRRWNFYSKLGYAFAPDLHAWLSVNAANDNHGNWIFWKDLGHALLTADSTTTYQRIYSFKLHSSAIVEYNPSTNIVSWFRAGVYRTTVDDNINPLGPDSASHMTSHAMAYTVEEQLTHQINARSLLTYGAQATANVVNSNYYGNRSQWDGALYAQMEHHPTSQIVTTLGLRGTIARSENQVADGRVDPKFGIAYTVDDDLSFRASAGTGFREPSLAERFISTRTGTLLTLPNPYLQLERSASYEIGTNMIVHAGNIPVTIDAAVFWSEYWNLIEPNFVCALPAQIQFENVTRARIQGIDMHVTAPLIDQHLSLSLGYTYMNGRDLNLDAPLKYRPKHLFIGGLNTTWGALSGGFDVRFASRVDRIDDTVAACVNPLTGYSVIPDFGLRVQTFVTDARVSCDLRPLTTMPLRFTLNVYNLFQYYYVEIPANLAPIRNFVAQVELVF